MAVCKEFATNLRKKINEIYEQNELANLEANQNRARSFTVGTAFGGIIEVSMRGDFHSLWCLLQPVEAVEFIEQLAAAAGLQVALRPKQDFASWRGWNADTDDRYWVGSAQWQISNDNSDQKMLESSKEEKEKKPTRKKKKSVEVIVDKIEEELNNEEILD
jgi:hypothetical protein